MTAVDVTDPQTIDVDAVMGSLLADVAAAAGLQMTHLGIRTGLWKALAGAGPLTAAEVAARSGVVEPYAREWLKHQAVSGYLHHDGDRFTLPEAVAAVLADDTTSGVVEGFASMLAAMATDNAMVEQAWRTGGGVGWHERSPEHWSGMDRATQAMVVGQLTGAWIPALDGVQARLRAGGTVADVGCGYGAPLITLAQAHPAARGVGIDYHDGSVAHARRAAAAAGVADRVAFEVAEATGVPPSPTGAGYDLVLFVDTLHDLGDPLAALRRALQVLDPEGSVLVVEFAAADRLEDNANPMGRLLYASSALVCTPNAIAQGAADPLGTAPGEARLRELAGTAGFTRVRRLEVDAPMNLLLELRP